jgi:hypothetical protein
MSTLFLFDHVWTQERPNPNIAVHRAEPYTLGWRQFSQVWPYSEPINFYEHCLQHGVDVQAVTLDQLQSQCALYAISLTWWDHAVDYIHLIPDAVKSLVRQGQVRLVFFYTEGDNPGLIRRHLDRMAQTNLIDPDAVHLVSANSEADVIRGCSYFPDDELLYLQRNQACAAQQYHEQDRQFVFTCLNRTHKWWRCATMTQLQQIGALSQAQWSYNSTVTIGDDITDCAISVFNHGNLFEQMQHFLAQGPYSADQLTQQQHNDHSHQIAEHYANSYFQVVLETHFDADGSRGTFLTEKTFKPIKNCQPFVLFAPAHSLAQLRQLGYRTFDHVIDPSYDSIQNNNKRWLRVIGTIKTLLQQDPKQMYIKCRDDLIHNQQLFHSTKQSRLNKVLKEIYESSKQLHQLATT